MLQVDENIGGRQDQKNHSLRTKTLAVGLLMMLGCFAVGYFNATTTSATTRASQELTTNNIPNDDAPQCTDDGLCPLPWKDLAHLSDYVDFYCCSKTYTFDPDCLTPTKGYAVRCGATAPPLLRPQEDASTRSAASSASVLRGFADTVVGEVAHKAGPGIRCDHDDQCPRTEGGTRMCCGQRGYCVSVMSFYDRSCA